MYLGATATGISTHALQLERVLLLLLLLHGCCVKATHPLPLASMGSKAAPPNEWTVYIIGHRNIAQSRTRNTRNVEQVQLEEGESIGSTEGSAFGTDELQESEAGCRHDQHAPPARLRGSVLTSEEAIQVIKMSRPQHSCNIVCGITSSY